MGLLAGDALFIALAVLASYWYRYHSGLDRIPVPGESAPDFKRYLAAIPVVVVVMIVTLFLNRAYIQARGRALLDESYGIIGGLALGAVLLLAIMALYRGFSYSRLMVIYVAVSAAVLVILFRSLMRVVVSQLRRHGLGTTRALVVGSGTGADAIIHRLEMYPEYGYKLVGVVDEMLPGGSEYHRLPVLGDPSELQHVVMNNNVEEVFIALPQVDHRHILQLIGTCEDLDVEFKIVPDLLEVITSGVIADDIDGIPIIGVRRSRLVGVNLLVKRVFDTVIAVLLLVPGVPLMAVIALAIRADSRGPVIYTQDRVGRNSRVFGIHKFRSMVPDAEADSGPRFADRDDPRTTRVGRFLRRTGLDEVPQVFNVLKGQMSLVGPRPERPHFVNQFERDIPGYEQRHAVSPGITGWAQLNDLRQDTAIEQRTIYDTYYVENWSLAFDLKILLATLV
ncbi:MAG: undecaprenyl-phosphate glucose phosphotransferase, partial [Candidatus Dormibacteraeota bacterium]|nr:undecaprenyl-phosphate glucose phosphotransferase [Candidatus Dormibacteraeota bacterium]